MEEESPQIDWSSKRIPANSEYAYSDLVRDEDEKIFCMLKEGVYRPSAPFRFLPESESEPVLTPEISAFLSPFVSKPLPARPAPKGPVSRQEFVAIFSHLYRFRTDAAVAAQGRVQEAQLSEAAEGFYRGEKNWVQVYKEWEEARSQLVRLARQNHKYARWKFKQKESIRSLKQRQNRLAK